MRDWNTYTIIEGIIDIITESLFLHSMLRIKNLLSR